MEPEPRRSALPAVAAVIAAIALVVVIALVVLDDDGEETATVTDRTTEVTTVEDDTTSTQPVVSDPENEAALTIDNCISLWNNERNNEAQELLETGSGVDDPSALTINVGFTATQPRACVVTAIASEDRALQFAEGGGATFPYTVPPTEVDPAELTEEQRQRNAAVGPDGTLTPAG